MLIALSILAVLEAAAPPAVALTLSGSTGAPVSAAPRTLSDVAREMREGRRAVGGFSAVETTVSRGPIVLPVLEWDEEEARPEPRVVPEQQPPGDAVSYVSGWTGGWSCGAPRRRPPHPRHVMRPSARPPSQPGAGASPRAGAPQVPRSAAQPSGVRTRAAFSRR